MDDFVEPSEIAMSIITCDELKVGNSGVVLQLREGVGRVPWIRPVGAKNDPRHPHHLINHGWLELSNISSIVSLVDTFVEACSILDCVATVDMPASLEVSVCVCVYDVCRGLVVLEWWSAPFID